jgi:hypothetical protein
MEELWRRLLPTIWENVVAAGNLGNQDRGHSLDEYVPQKLGTAANGLITVGGVLADGVLDPLTTFDLGIGGSLICLCGFPRRHCR